VALTNLWNAGIRHFDSASLGEIEAVKSLFPDAVCHFMAPVRLPGQAKAAFEKYGVTDFVVDSDAELDKLLAEIPSPKKLRVFVRLVAQLGGALLEMSSKYGCRPEEAAKLLKRVAVAGAAPCLTFHVGSQCLSPFSYAQAIEIAQRTVTLSGVEIAADDATRGWRGFSPDVQVHVVPGNHRTMFAEPNVRDSSRDKLVWNKDSKESSSRNLRRSWIHNS